MQDAYAGPRPVNVTTFVCAKPARVRYDARRLFSRPSEPENTDERTKCRSRSIPDAPHGMRLGDRYKTGQNESSGNPSRVLVPWGLPVGFLAGPRWSPRSNRPRFVFTSKARFALSVPENYAM